jgi:hypothetical protein
MADGVFKIRRRVVPAVGPRFTSADYEVFDPWYEADFAGMWTASFRIAIQNGRPVFGEVRVFPTGDRHEPDVEYEPGEWSAQWDGPEAEVPPGGLTATLLRKVPFDVVLSALPEIVQWIKEHRPEDWEFLSGSGLATADLERPRPGPKGPTEEELVEYAVEYLELVGRKVKNPHTVLSERYGCKNSHRSKHLVDLARDRGLLAPPDPGDNDKHGGRAGGMLTPRGEEVLRKMKKDRKRKTE